MGTVVTGPVAIDPLAVDQTCRPVPIAAAGACIQRDRRVDPSCN